LPPFRLLPNPRPSSRNFRSLERARSLADQLREAGFLPRLVRTPGNDLARVRIGRFISREGAEAQARGLEGLGFEVTLVTDAGSEERVGEPFPPDPPLSDRPS